MDITMMIGLLAGLLTTLAFVPQLTKTWKSKSAKDVSLVMLGTFTTGVLLWLIYGVLIQGPPIIAANVVTFAWPPPCWPLKFAMGKYPVVDLAERSAFPESVLVTCQSVFNEAASSGFGSATHQHIDTFGD